jgi:exopolysaccharide biosynthesis polyprenyl glycosylphosphotransferase
MVSAIWIRLGFESLNLYIIANIHAWLIFLGSVLVANYLAGSYGIQISLSRFNILVNWAFSLFVAFLVISITSLAWFKIMLGRGVLALSIINYSLFWLALRVVLYGYLFSKRPFLCRVAVIGDHRACEEMRAIVESPDIFPAHDVVAFLRLVEERPEPTGRADTTASGMLMLDLPPSQLGLALESMDVDVVILAHSGHHLVVQAYPDLRRLRFRGKLVLGPLGAAEIYSGRIPLEEVDELWLMQMSAHSAGPNVIRVKRLTDIGGALIALALSLPLMVLVALAIKVSKPSAPVIYSQNRVGWLGRVFRMYKFRTMVQNAEAHTGATWSPEHDRRITRLGYWLRKFRLDELPQLFNILRGDMSMVGPRPERPEIVQSLESEIPYYSERENVMPGLTGWAQIRYPYGWTIDDARRKLEYDFYYIKNISFSLDLQIILRTVRTVILGMERRVRWRAEALGDFLRRLHKHPTGPSASRGKPDDGSQGSMQADGGDPIQRFST